MILQREDLTRGQEHVKRTQIREAADNSQIILLPVDCSSNRREEDDA